MFFFLLILIKLTQNESDNSLFKSDSQTNLFYEHAVAIRKKSVLVQNGCIVGI